MEAVAIPRTGTARAVKWSAGWLLTVALIAGWFAFLRPVALGGSVTFIRVTGTSMHPTMEAGDLAVSQRKSSYHVGDVVAYRVPEGQPGAGMKIIHRIVAGDVEGGYITKGDNNGYTDAWKPTPSQILGKVWVTVPSAAGWLAKLGTPLGLAAVAGATTFVIVAFPAKRRRVAVPSTTEPCKFAPGHVGIVWTALAVQLTAAVVVVVTRT